MVDMELTQNAKQGTKKDLRTGKKQVHFIM